MTARHIKTLIILSIGFSLELCFKGDERRWLRFCPSLKTFGNADTFHKPGLKMQARILHHLFRVVSTNVIKAPLWDVSARGASAFPSNTAYVQQQVSQLLSTSFPNMKPQQVEVSYFPLLLSLTPPCNWRFQTSSESFCSGGTR